MIATIQGPPCSECGIPDHGHAIGCSQIEVESLAGAMDLLAKLASGEGGRRTGALRRAGFLTWQVTPAGLEALAKEKR